MSGVICKKMKSSSSSDGDSDSLDGSYDSYDLSESINDIYVDWLNDFLLAYHDEMEALEKKKYTIMGQNYQDGVINFLIHYDNLNQCHFIKIAEYLEVEPILVYSSYLKLMRQKK